MDEAALSACLQPDGPLRPTFCNIPGWGQAFVYFGGVLAVAIFAYGLQRHWRAWRGGRGRGPARHLGHYRRRLGFAARYALGQQATLARRLPGTFHSGIFFGFVILFVGTVLATIDWDAFHLLFDRRILAGRPYLAYELALDTFGVVFTVGLVVAMWRRYVLRPAHVRGAWDFVLWSLLVVSVTGFGVEALRLHVAPVEWGRYSWAGQAIAHALRPALSTAEQGELVALYTLTWVVHAAAAFLFIAAIPFTNAVHLVTSAANATLKSVEPVTPGAALAPLDIDHAETFGVGRLDEFSCKQRLGFDSCVACGRCETVCPAHMSGTPLNPKGVIVALSRALRDDLDRLEPTAAVPSPDLAVTGAIDGAPGPGAEQATVPLLVGDDLAISPGALWACTTCAACVEVCPSFIEIVDDIVDMRRYATLTEGALPGTSAMALRGMAIAGNPWGYPPEERMDWAHGLDVPVARPGVHVDVLYWVGCSAAYDPRNQRIARAVVRLLTASGVDFAVMREERCHCESARRMGEEYLFQTAAAENVASLARYSFGRLLAHCPHCYNTLRNEYPEFGARYEIVHHSQLLSELVAFGRLPALTPGGGRVVFHDSCYLGRYNREFDAPRALLRVGGAELIELPRRRENGLCCGGGGGKMWFEDERHGAKVEDLRLAEALAAAPETLAVACPFCLTMLDGAVKSLGVDNVAVLDVAEVLAGALGDADGRSLTAVPAGGFGPPSPDVVGAADAEAVNRDGGGR